MQYDTVILGGRGRRHDVRGPRGADRCCRWTMPKHRARKIRISGRRRRCNFTNIALHGPQAFILRPSPFRQISSCPLTPVWDFYIELVGPRMASRGTRKPSDSCSCGTPPPKSIGRHAARIDAKKLVWICGCSAP